MIIFYSSKNSVLCGCTRDFPQHYHVQNNTKKYNKISSITDKIDYFKLRNNGERVDGNTKSEIIQKEKD